MANPQLRRCPVCNTPSDLEAEAALRHKIGVKSLQNLGAIEEFNLICNLLAARDISVGYFYTRSPIRIEFSQSSTFTYLLALTGQASISLEANGFEFEAPQAAVIPNDQQWAANYSREYSHLFLQIEPSALTRTVASLIGNASPRAAHVNLDAQKPAEAEHLKKIVKVFVEEIDLEGSDYESSITLQQLAKTIVTSFISANWNNIKSQFSKSTLVTIPWQVLQVEDYLQNHWKEPLAISQLATITGVSARSIFYGFAQSRGYSPKAYLKQVRLKNARERLLTPHSHTSVTAVALECGFQNLGHFAREYRAMFGELPSDTLATAKSTLQLAPAEK